MQGILWFWMVNSFKIIFQPLHFDTKTCFWKLFPRALFHNLTVLSETSKNKKNQKKWKQKKKKQNLTFPKQVPSLEQLIPPTPAWDSVCN